MGRNGLKTQSKVAVLFIFFACCIALYCLFMKINRILALAELDKTAPFETVITSAVYLNSSFSGESSASMKFILHSQGRPPNDLFCESRNPVGKLSSPMTTQLLGPGRVYLGTCDVLEPGFSVDLTNEQFTATLDPDLFPRRQKSAVCLSLAFLYDDLPSLRALLKHYSAQDAIVEIYVASWHEAALKEAENYPNVHVIWWPMLDAKRETTRKGKIQLEVEEYQQSMKASFGDCWLRNGPIAEKVAFVEIGQLGGMKKEKMGRRIEFFREGWRIKTLITAAVQNVSEKSLTIAESCSGHCGQQPSTTDDKPSKSSFILKRLPTKVKIENTYEEDLKRCSFRREYSRRTKQLLKKSPFFAKIENPCYFPSYREGYKCRVASHITKRMFSDDTKVSVVQKRSMLRFYNGCQ